LTHMVLVWSLGAAALNAVVGILMVLGVFALMEKHVGAGAVGGITLGTVVIYAKPRSAKRTLLSQSLR